MKLSSRVRLWPLMVVVLTMAGSALVPGSQAADDAGDEAATKDSKWGKFGLYLRYRFEFVDDDAVEDSGYASTLRTVLHYTTPDWHHLGAFLQFKDVSDLGATNQHSVDGRPAIPDPPNTSVEQFYASYDGLTDTDFKLGMQEIDLDQQRFVGAVAWRQTHQTFDSFRVIQKSIPRTTWTYAYVDKANTITTRVDGMTTHLFNAGVNIMDVGTLTPYIYSIDYDSDSRAEFSTISYGLRWRGTCDPGNGWKFPYHAEYAQQNDTGSNPDDVEAMYYRLEAEAKREKWWARIGYEVLGGSVEDGQFNTPLATLHKWNGWADKFLVTPDDGLQDLYLGGGGKVGPVSLVGFYHHFSSDSESLTYGQELDAQASYKAPWKQVFALKLAYYDADDLKEDTLKVWFLSTYRF